MKNNLLRKFMFLNTIILVIILVITQSIYASVDQKNITDYNNTEILIQTSSIQGTRNIQIRITEQQANQLEHIFEMMKIKLAKIKTNEDVITVYKESIELLHRAGLLPHNMKLDEIRDIVIGEHKNIHKCDRTRFDNNSNINCLISGSTSNTIFAGLRVRFWLPFRIFFRWNVAYPFSELIPYDLFPLISEFYELLCDFILYRWAFAISLNQINPISLERMIYLGQIFHWDIKPAKGWIHTIGLNGIMKWNGSFYGDLPHTCLTMLSECPGILGFYGIQIKVGESSHYYLGHARWVKIRLD